MRAILRHSGDETLFPETGRDCDLRQLRVQLTQSLSSPKCNQGFVTGATYLSGDPTLQEPNALRVRKVDDPARAPLSDEQLAQRAARCLLDGLYFSYYCVQTSLAQPSNEISAPVSSGPFEGMATQWTSKANICLADDEVMIITTSSAVRRDGSGEVPTISARVIKFRDLGREL